MRPVWASDGEQVFYGFPVYGETATKLARDLCGRCISSEERVFEATSRRPICSGAGG